jgi:hypothetical protein
MTNLRNFAKHIRSVEKRIMEELNQAANDAALIVLDDLVNNTPVDTSNALSNWQISLGTPIMDERPPYFPGIKGSTREESAAATMAAGRFILRTKKPGEIIYLSNNAPYIVGLNEGLTSALNRGGFVERACEKGRNELKKVKLDL